MVELEFYVHINMVKNTSKEALSGLIFEGLDKQTVEGIEYFKILFCSIRDPDVRVD